MDVEKRITLAEEPPLRIGALVVEPAARTVIGQDSTSERLEPRVMQVLVQLARAAGGVVSRESLTIGCWGGQIVGEDAINRVISRLRRLADERKADFRIETIPRVGYRLLGEVAPVAHPEPPPAPGLPAPVPALTLIRQGDARRRKFWVRWATAGTLVSVALAGLAGEAVRARGEARARRADAEQLVDFMLGDLRKRLDAVGRLDVLDAVGAQTMAYYGKQDVTSLNADELARRAKALRMVGELRSRRGDLGAALAAYTQAAATTDELLSRDPKNGQRVFDHMQSVFALGDVAQHRGDRETETRSFKTYAQLADRLIAIDPKRDDWQAEFAYSRHNRGAIESTHRQVGLAIQDFRTAARVLNGLRKTHPENADYQNGFAQANAWMADALRVAGSPGQALAARSIEASVYRQQVSIEPTNMDALQQLSWSEHAQGELAHELGDVSDAAAHLRQAQLLVNRQMAVEPTNVLTIERAVPILYDLAFVDSEIGKLGDATAAITTAHRLTTDLIARDGSMARWRELGARTDIVRAELAWMAGNMELSKWLALPASETLERTGARTDSAEGPLWLARAQLLLARLYPPAAASHWRTVVTILAPLRPNLRVGERCALAQALNGLAALKTPERFPVATSPLAIQRCGHWPWITALHSEHT